jgi:hypothetical protein
MSRIYYFHYPNKAVHHSQKRYTVAFTLVKTNQTRDQDTWLLSYGATLFSPDSSIKQTIKKNHQTPRNCEGCKKNHGLCDSCKPIRMEIRKLMSEYSWNKGIHIKRARERLMNSPVQIILWSEACRQMHHYQFRRVERFIISRIHQYGVSAEATELTPAVPEPIQDFAEYGYTLMDDALTQSEQEDYHRFLDEVYSKNDVQTMTIEKPAITISYDGVVLLVICWLSIVLYKMWKM